MYAERVPPHDLEAEEAVLGSLVIDGEAILKISPFLRSDDFYRDRNRWCYEACLELFRRAEAIDQATIGHELARLNRLDEVGGHAFLSQVAAVVPTSVNVEHYARIVQRTSVMRQVISAAGEIAALGYEDDPDVEGTLSRAEDVLFRVRTGRSSRDFIHIREILDKFLEETARTVRMGTLERGVLRPLPPASQWTWTRLLGGLHRSDLIIVAGRPAMGKSSLAMSIVRSAAGLGATAAVFSLEMSRDQLVLRLLAGETGVDSHLLRLGHVLRGRTSAALSMLWAPSPTCPVYIDDNPLSTVVDVRSKSRRLHLERGLGHDRRGLPPAHRRARTVAAHNRVQEIGEITRSLKALARDLNVPVVAVSQLSRAVEMRQSHRPQLSDLRESGSIEQDADVVMFIYRDDKYITEEEWDQRLPGPPVSRGTSPRSWWPSTATARPGTVRLHFRDKLAQFADRLTDPRAVRGCLVSAFAGFPDRSSYVPVPAAVFSQLAGGGPRPGGAPMPPSGALPAPPTARAHSLPHSQRARERRYAAACRSGTGARPS